MQFWSIKQRRAAVTLPPPLRRCHMSGRCAVMHVSARERASSPVCRFKSARWLAPGCTFVQRRSLLLFPLKLHPLHRMCVCRVRARVQCNDLQTGLTECSNRIKTPSDCAENTSTVAQGHRGECQIVTGAARQPSGPTPEHQPRRLLSPFTSVTTWILCVSVGVL